MIDNNRLLSLIRPPPKKLKGWPWTEESQSCTLDDYPRITIVTPSYNQAEYLEETIRSILLQNYPNLEYIVIDGGSTDGSVEIIERYAPWLSYWESEPDRGQSHAINKGLAHSTGELFNWINSDDFLRPGALYSLANSVEAPDEPLCLIGQMDVLQGREVSRIAKLEALPKDWCSFQTMPILQQAMFYTRSALDRMGPLHEDLHYSMDYEWLLRFLFAFGFEQLQLIEQPLAGFRYHEASKSSLAVERFFADKASISAEMAQAVKPPAVVAYLRGLTQYAKQYQWPSHLKGCLTQEDWDSLVIPELVRHFGRLHQRRDFEAAQVMFSLLDPASVSLPSTYMTHLRFLEAYVKNRGWWWFRLQRSWAYRVRGKHLHEA